MNVAMSENKQTTDSELLLQIVGYNSDAFEQLYNRYSATIYSLIKEIVTNPKLAEKILLNVFSVFLKRIDHYSTNSNNIFTWLTLLARNISIDTLKRMKFIEDIPIYSDDYEIEFILPNLSQEITLINLDEREALGEKIKSYKNHLTEVQNLVLSLIYFEGLNEEEIAKRLNVPVATVRQKTIGIMESLHNQYTGKVEQGINNKELLSLVRLESLGYLSSEERMLFNQMRNNDPDFLWKEYGEYQNLTALLSTAITITKPAHELNAELKNIFTKILQGSDVEYPIIASEISVAETIINSIPEPLPEKIIAPEVKEKAETKEEKDSGFHIRFRERDPKELSLLKKLETVEVKPTPAPVYAKVEKEIQFRDYRTAVKKPNVLADRKDSVLNNNDIIKAVITEDNIVQNKISNTEIQKPDLQIENDDPLIIIEETKPIMVKDNATVNNKLIPNSSINLKEIFKKEDKTSDKNENNQVNAKTENIIQTKSVTPAIENQDIKPKTNEVINVIQKTASVATKEENVIPNKPAMPVVANSDIKFKTNEPPKEFRRSNIFVDREEKAVQQKPVAPVVEKSDIKIKTNEAPKEFGKSNLFVDKTIKPFEQKSPVSIVEKTEIVNKPSELSKENKITESTILKVEQTLQNKPFEPVVNNSDIKIKTNEPPKEIQKQRPSVVKAETLAQINLKAKTTEQPEVKTNEQKKEISKNVTSIEKNDLAIQTAASTPVIAKTEIRFRTNDTIKQKEEIKPEIKEDSNLSKSVNPLVDRSNLRIRETVFTEKISKPETKDKNTSSSVKQSNTDNEIIPAVKALTDSINIDEILTKIEDDKPAIAEISETDSYEKEIVKLRKKLRRNILVSAALIAIIVASSIFIYLKFQQVPLTVTSSAAGSEKLNLTGQSNLVLNNEYNPSTESEITEEAIETLSSKETVTDQKVIIPPLPESLTKEESTLFASNVNSNSLASNDEKETTQTAAAKTETIIPPKEIKKIEEETAFFVAVEEMPELVGGLKTLQGKIKYPEIAKRVGVEGKVLVQAVVDETGNVISVSTIKGIGSGCDEVAMDAVRNSKFTPGKQRGKNVKVQVTIPIVFKK